MLVDKLCLDYDFYNTALHNYTDGNINLWVLKKIYSYSLQKEPFINVDSDAFIFKKLSTKLLSASLIAQNVEFGHHYYIKSLREIQTFPYIPEFLMNSQIENLSAVNAGIIGGNNTSYFKDFLVFVEKFIYNNSTYLNNIDLHSFNIFLEQMMFKQYADHLKIPVDTVLWRQIGPLDDYNVNNYVNLPHNVEYAHVMNYKSNPSICEQIVQRLWLEAPHLYERVEAVCRQIEATHHSVNTPAAPAYQPFYRVQALLEALGLPVSNQPFDQQIAALPDTPTKAVLTDLLQYETSRQEAMQSLPPPAQRWHNWQTYSRQVNDLLAEPEAVWQQAHIGLHPATVRIESEWDWAEVNEFAGQTAARNGADNLTAEPAYYEVVLLYYPHQDLLREQLLDALNMLLFDALSEPLPIEAVVETLVEQVYQPQTDIVQLSALVYSRIRHFLYHGALQIVS